MASASRFARCTKTWTYRELLERANRIAHVLIEDCGLIAGNRVLLRGVNAPMLVASWFAVLKAGGIAVTTMPMLRAHELSAIARKAKIEHVICEQRLCNEVALAAKETGLSACRELRGRRSRSAHGAEVGDVRKRGDRGGRREPARVYVGHHRRSEGDDAFPPRRAGDGGHSRSTSAEDDAG